MRSFSPRKRLVVMLLVGGAYAVAAKLSFLVTIPPGNISPVFPAAGIALAAVLLWGRGVLPGVWAGSFVVNLISFSGGTLEGALAPKALAAGACIGLGAAGGAWLGSACVRRFCPGGGLLSGARQVGCLLLFGALTGCLVSPTVGVGSLTLAGYIRPPDAAFAWLTWWIGDTIGAVVMAPLLLAWGDSVTVHPRRKQALVFEAVALACATGAMVYFAFFRHVPIDYLALPLLGWASLRFGMRGVTSVALVITCAAAVGTSMGVSVMSGAAGMSPLLLLYSYLGAIMVFAFIFAGLSEERRLHAEGLRASEERFKIAVNAAKIGVWDWDVVNNRLFWDDSMFRLYGIRREDFANAFDAWLACVHPDDATRAASALRSASETGSEGGEEFRIRWPDGTVRHILSGSTTFRDASGRVLRMVGANIDITDRKKAESRDRHIRHILELVASGKPLPEILEVVCHSVQKDLPGALASVLLFDAATNRLRHGAAPDLPGFYQKAVDGIAAVRGAGSCGSAAADAAPVIVEDILTHPYWADFKEVATRAGLRACWSMPILTSSGAVVATFAIYHRETYAPTAEDMEAVRVFVESIRIAVESERSREELRLHRENLERTVRERTAELERAKDSAESANRAKSVFLSNMSHELRTPLNAILGYAQMMLRDRPADHPDAEALRIVNKSGEHLLGLINSVLDLTKIETHKHSLEPEDFDLGDFVRGIVDMLRRRAEDKGITLSVDQTSSFPRFIRADRNKLRQVLINIVGNAVKFTDTGGVSLRLSTGGPKGDDGTGRLVFSVTDTGPGILPEDAEKIFRPFEQAFGKHKGEGTGLGLTLAREFVRLMGGDVSVSAAPGGGSVFTFDIRYVPVGPAVAAQVGAAKTGGVTAVEGAAGVRVLIVEDQLENRVLLKKLLTRFGFTVAEAANGEIGVRMAEEWKPDMIFMDRRMPVMDGLVATKRIRELPGGDRFRIAAVTAEAFKEDYDSMMAAGCDAFVRKPYGVDEILECLGALPSVQLVRAAPAPVEAAPVSDAKEIARAAFAKLPGDVVKALRVACAEVDSEKISKLLAPHPAVAAAAEPFLQNFRTDVIESLLPAI